MVCTRLWIQALALIGVTIILSIYSPQVSAGAYDYDGTKQRLDVLLTNID